MPIWAKFLAIIGANLSSHCHHGTLLFSFASILSFREPAILLSSSLEIYSNVVIIIGHIIPVNEEKGDVSLPMMLLPAVDALGGGLPRRAHRGDDDKTLDICRRPADTPGARGHHFGREKGASR